jgi:hypothetical protein
MRQASTITSDGMKSRVPEARVRMNRKQRRDVALGARAEANAEIVVDRVDLIGEVRLEEDVADDDAPDDEPQDQLDVREALLGVALAGRAEKVAALVSAAMIDAITAHHGTRRPPSAKSFRLFSRRPM